MTKKFFYGLVIIIIMSNIAMATIYNNGQEINSNFFMIVITLILFPSYLSKIEQKNNPTDQLKLFSLMLLTFLSIFRLINRIHPLPSIVNLPIVILAIITGTILLINHINSKK